MKKSKRARACDISKAVKETVWQRDKHCIFCGDSQAKPNAHYIPRSGGGLGVEQNVVTLCLSCHHRLDHTVERKTLLKVVKQYLDIFYPGFTDSERRYKK